MNTLKFVGLNLDIEWKSKENNFSIIERELDKIIADVFILPEMFSTGFCMNADEIADKNHETLSWMRVFAKKKNAAICGSVSVKENNRFYNRFYFVKPDGSYEHYDKRHLFSFSGEDRIYTPGIERKIINYKGCNILLQICYDLRFPVFSRNNNDYDCILYVANWPTSRVEAWVHLLKARAIENQAYVFGVNRIGTDGNHLQYTESSHCFFGDGRLISHIDNHLIYAELNLNELREFRKKFQFMNDRDSFKLL